MKIKVPCWGTGGCLANRHITIPEGWLGLRQDRVDYWAVTGVIGEEWKTLRYFKTEVEAEEFALALYYEQVQKFLDTYCEL